MKQGFQIINNLKLKMKFTLLFVLCMLIPMITLDLTILFYINKSEMKEQEMSQNILLDRVKFYLDTAITSCYTISDYAYSDRTIYEFLSTPYADVTQYYDSYLNFQRSNGIRYTSALKEIKNITFYTSNNSILSGGYFKQLSEVQTTDWYQCYANSGKDDFLYESNHMSEHTTKNDQYTIEEDTDLHIGNKDPIVISIIRELNYYDCDSIDLLKIDINLDEFNSFLLQEETDKKIYICSDDIIIFSNGPQDEANKNIYSIAKSRINHSPKKTVFLPNHEWQIYAFADIAPLWTKVITSKTNILVFLFVILLLPTIILFIIERSMVYRINILKNKFKEIEDECFTTLEGNLGKDEIGILITHYNHTVIRIKELMSILVNKTMEKNALELSKKQAELNALMSQVNPHFIYNSLESICMRSMIKGERETAEIVRSMSLLFREMSTWENDIRSIKEELDFVKRYLQIQKYRFGDKITYSIELSSDCYELLIPKLTVVSLVENACVHGIENSLYNGCVWIGVTKESSIYKIEIRDNGCGIEQDEFELLKDQLTHASIGLLNTSKRTGILNAYLRLQMMYGEHMNLTIHSTPEIGSTILIQISCSDNSL